MRARADGGMISSGRSGGSEQPAAGFSSVGSKAADASQDPLGDFAADLGKFLGGVQSKASSWLDQRKAIADQLTQIRDTANQYLQQLSGAGANLAGAVARRGRPPGSGQARRGPARPAASPNAAPEAVRKTGGRRKGFKMSAEARAKIAAAQKKRWARQRKESAG